MKNVLRFIFSGLQIVFVLLSSCSNTGNSESGLQDSIMEFYTLDDFPAVAKIDAHLHIQNYADTVFVNQAARDNFRFLNLNVFLSQEASPLKNNKNFQESWWILFRGEMPG